MAKTRTFIGVPADESVEIAALAAIDQLRSTGDGIRWVDGENLHWTLQFLGDLTDVEMHDVCRKTMAAAAEHAPFTLFAQGVGAFPSAAKPRTLWLGVSDQPDSGGSEFCALQASIEDRMASLGFRGESRRFVPHLTLGRAAQGRTNLAFLVDRLQSLRDFPGGEMWVDEVIVYASELTRDGPVYQTLARAPLRG